MPACGVARLEPGSALPGMHLPELGRHRPKAIGRAPAPASAPASTALDLLRELASVLFERTEHIIEQLQPTAGEHRGAVAILSDGAAVVGDQDNVGATHPLAKRRGASMPEPLVADLGDLVDQVHVEVDCQA